MNQLPGRWKVTNCIWWVSASPHNVERYTVVFIDVEEIAVTRLGFTIVNCEVFWREHYFVWVNNCNIVLKNHLLCALWPRDMWQYVAEIAWLLIKSWTRRQRTCSREIRGTDGPIQPVKLMGVFEISMLCGGAPFFPVVATNCQLSAREDAKTCLQFYEYSWVLLSTVFVLFEAKPVI